MVKVSCRIIHHISDADDAEDASRFANISLDEVRGEIYTLCRDQHGCRYLQKKLEERKPESVQTIFAEVNEHMVELMTGTSQILVLWNDDKTLSLYVDPFGNYLCQKLLEHANEDQRTVLINNAAPDLVNIALNQHGTRALQKMIEFVSTPTQVCLKTSTTTGVSAVELIRTRLKLLSSPCNIVLCR